MKSSMIENCSDQVEINILNGVQISLDMLTGSGKFSDLGQQSTYDFQTYAQISECAQRAWREFPSQREKTLDPIQIWQRPEKNFSDFIAHLYQATNCLISDLSTSETLVN